MGLKNLTGLALTSVFVYQNIFSVVPARIYRVQSVSLARGSPSVLVNHVCLNWHTL